MLQVNPNLAPKNTVDLLINFEVDEEIGSLASRLGTERIGSQLVDNVTCLGVVQHVDQADTTKNKLFATFDDAVSATNADIYDVSAGTKSLQDDTKNIRTYFLNYQGDTLRLNGTDAPKAYNSSTWLTTGGVFDLGNMPTGYKYAAEFLDRVYLWGKASAPYTLAYSGILTAGAVSWTAGNGTVEIEPEDGGGEATGVGKVPGYLLLFKRRSMHRFNFSSAFPEALTNIGAYSQESIINAGGLCAFYSDSNENAKGFYITNGGRPTPISHDTTRPIKKWVDAISSSATVAGWGTERYFAWSVGDLTVDGETYTNVVFKFNRILNQWTIRTTPTKFTYFAGYVTGGVHTIVGGDNDGNVIRVDKPATYTDAPSATPIPLKVRTHHTTFGYNQLKTLSDIIVVRGRNLQNYIANAIIDRDVNNTVSLTPPDKWKRLLSLLKIGQTVKGTTISTEIMTESTGARVYIDEIEWPNIDVTEGYE